MKPLRVFCFCAVMLVAAPVVIACMVFVDTLKGAYRGACDGLYAYWPTAATFHTLLYGLLHPHKAAALLNEKD